MTKATAARTLWSWGKRLAEAMDARLIVASVLQLDPRFAGLEPHFREVNAEATKRVERTAMAVGAEAAMIASGSPARGLHDLAEQKDADFIVVGSSREAGSVECSRTVRVSGSCTARRAQWRSRRWDYMSAKARGSDR